MEDKIINLLMKTPNKFNKLDNIILTEIERRLRFFKKPLTYDLLVLLTPYEAKRLVNMGYIKPYSNEVPRVPNWYCLTSNGVELFKNVYNKPIDNKENISMFKGEKINNYNLIVN
jgi:hypothetical protein